MTRATLMTTASALAVLCAGAASAAVLQGTVSTFSDSSGIDLTNIIYATNSGSDENRTVGGVTFIGQTNENPGVTYVVAERLLDDAATMPDYDGGTATENELEELMRDAVYGNGTSFALPEITFDTVAGSSYILQIMIYDTGYNGGTDRDRNFDILVDGVAVVTDEVLDTDPSNTIGRLYTLTFTADGDDTQLTFGKGTGPDPNPVFSAVTLANVPEPGSLALLGLGGLAMLRRRR